MLIDVDDGNFSSIHISSRRDDLGLEMPLVSDEQSITTQTTLLDDIQSLSYCQSTVRVLPSLLCMTIPKLIQSIRKATNLSC